MGLLDDNDSLLMRESIENVLNGNNDFTDGCPPELGQIEPKVSANDNQEELKQNPSLQLKKLALLEEP